MTRFHFERPDGIQGSPQTILIHLNEFVPPQGFGGAAVANGVMAYEDLDIMGYEPVDWFFVQWQKRIQLTINIGQVPSTQTDFPLLINDVYPDLIGEVEAELRFTGSDNIQLDYEIEKFDNVTGELVAWIKKPSVSDGDTLRMYFDNPAAVDEQNAPAVWSDYLAVWHMNQTAFGANSTIDSTGDALNNFSPQNMDISNQVSGKIDGTLKYNSGATVDERTEGVGSTTLRNLTNNFTVSIWVNHESFTSQLMTYLTNFQAGTGGVLWGLASANTMRFTTVGIQNYDIALASPIIAGQDVHLVFTFDSNNDASGFRDGVFQATEVGTTPAALATNNYVIGALLAATGGFIFKGDISELKVSQGIKSSDFIRTEFNNQNNQGTFYSTAAVEEMPTISMGYQE